MGEKVKLSSEWLVPCSVALCVVIFSSPCGEWKGEWKYILEKKSWIEFCSFVEIIIDTVNQRWL